MAPSSAASRLNANLAIGTASLAAAPFLAWGNGLPSRRAVVLAAALTVGVALLGTAFVRHDVLVKGVQVGLVGVMSIGEEALHRGLVVALLLPVFSLRTALATSVIGFALAHAPSGVAGVVQALVVGAVLAGVAWWSGAWICAGLLHLAYNLSLILRSVGVADV